MPKREGDITKLPHWARERILKLTDDLAGAHARLGEGPADSDTFLWSYVAPPTPLGRGRMIRFKVGEHYEEYIECCIDEQGTVEIRTGMNHLIVRPVVANAIEVRADR